MFSKRIGRYKPCRRNQGSCRYWKLASDRKYYKLLGEPSVRIPAYWQAFYDIWWWDGEAQSQKGSWKTYHDRHQYDHRKKFRT